MAGQSQEEQKDRATNQWYKQSATGTPFITEKRAAFCKDVGEQSLGPREGGPRRDLSLIISWSKGQHPLQVRPSDPHPTRETKSGSGSGKCFQKLETGQLCGQQSRKREVHFDHDKDRIMRLCPGVCPGVSPSAGSQWFVPAIPSGSLLQTSTVSLQTVYRPVISTQPPGHPPLSSSHPLWWVQVKPTPSPLYLLLSTSPQWESKEDRDGAKDTSDTRRGSGNDRHLVE